MKVEKLSSYIEKRIAKTRNAESDSHAEGTIRNSTGYSLEELARESASLGRPEVTASFLSLSSDNSVPVNLKVKGEIMAEAFRLQADRYDYVRKSYQGRATRSKKIAQRLTRAAKR